MDNPNALPNNSGIALEQGNAKKSIVLGVVNTSGMKSACSNRKRRWDQPPDESEDSPQEKKPFFNDSPENDSENWIAERLGEVVPEKSNQCNDVNSVGAGEKVLSDGASDSMDVVEDPSDRLLSPSDAPSPNPPAEQDPEASSPPVNAENTSVVNSISSNKDTSAEATDVTSEVSNTAKRRKSATIISFQSDELKRIMSSYNEGTSDSDISDSTEVSEAAVENSRLDVPDESSLLDSINENTLGVTEEGKPLPNDSKVIAEESVPAKLTVSDHLSKDTLGIQSDSAPSAFNDTSIVGSKVDVSPESQSHIPIQNENVIENSLTKVNCVDSTHSLGEQIPEVSNTSSLTELENGKSDSGLKVDHISSDRIDVEEECSELPNDLNDTEGVENSIIVNDISNTNLHNPPNENPESVEISSNEPEHVVCDETDQSSVKAESIVITNKSSVSKELCLEIVNSNKVKIGDEGKCEKVSLGPKITSGENIGLNSLSEKLLTTRVPTPVIEGLSDSNTMDETVNDRAVDKVREAIPITLSEVPEQSVKPLKERQENDDANSFDPKVMKVIFGGSCLEGLKEEEASLGPSTPDSDSASKSVDVVPSDSAFDDTEILKIFSDTSAKEPQSKEIELESEVAEVTETHEEKSLCPDPVIKNEVVEEEAIDSTEDPSGDEESGQGENKEEGITIESVISLEDGIILEETGVCEEEDTVEDSSLAVSLEIEVEKEESAHVVDEVVGESDEESEQVTENYVDINETQDRDQREDAEAVVSGLEEVRNDPSPAPQQVSETEDSASKPLPSEQEPVVKDEEVSLDATVNQEEKKAESDETEDDIPESLQVPEQDIPKQKVTEAKEPKIEECVNNVDESSVGAGYDLEECITEEIVEYESPDNDVAEEEVITNDEENSQIISEEVVEETVANSEQEKAVISSELKDSDGDNQNELVVESEVCVNTEESLSSGPFEKGPVSDDKKIDLTTKATSPVEEMECNEVNEAKSLDNSFVEAMDVDETPEVVENNLPSESEKPLSSGSVPPLQLIGSPAKEKLISKEDPSGGNISVTIPKDPQLDPITLKIPKDILTIKTESPSSPHKHSPRSPAKNQHSPIPNSSDSPKSKIKSTWKLESPSMSPGSPGEPLSPLRLRLTKPSTSLANEGSSHSEKSEAGGSEVEMGEAMVGEASGSLLAQALSRSEDTAVIKKRGRPRKAVEAEAVNDSPPPGGGSSSSTAIAGEEDPAGDQDDEAAGRQVRSCRARAIPVIAKPRKSRGGATAGISIRGGGRGGPRGVARPIGSAEEAKEIQEKLSEKEKAELAKIEARKEKMRLDRIAKREAKEAKKLAKKLKDEERRKRQLAEKAEKAAAAAPQVFEEETRMSASESRGHTPAPLSRLLPPVEGAEESQSSISTPNRGNRPGRMEIDLESDEVRVEQLAEYQWTGGELYMIQEQVSSYLGVKSFKRKYPDLKRRTVEAEERAFLEDSGLVSKAMSDLGLTAVSSTEILDIMFQDFPEKYEEFRQYVRDKQAREMSYKQKALASATQSAKAKGELREVALEAAAMWNSNLNRERREERKCALDLQTFTVHYPHQERARMSSLPLIPGLYPVSVIPGQFSDYYKTYTPNEMKYFPLNTVMYGPLKPNERLKVSSDGEVSSTDDSSSSSCESDSEDDDTTSKECKVCNGEKKVTSDAHPEILLQCSNCKGLCHPTCQEITPEMLPHIKKYSWHCSNCKKCIQCKNSTVEDKMLFCDLCDRGYHLSCVGLKKSPEGRWHCTVCSFCTMCGSKDPGGSPDWFYEYKTTEAGIRLYQRTLCAPCTKKL